MNDEFSREDDATKTGSIDVLVAASVAAAWCDSEVKRPTAQWLTVREQRSPESDRPWVYLGALKGRLEDKFGN